MIGIPRFGSAALIRIKSGSALPATRLPCYEPLEGEFGSTLNLEKL